MPNIVAYNDQGQPVDPESGQVIKDFPTQAQLNKNIKQIEKHIENNQQLTELEVSTEESPTPVVTLTETPMVVTKYEVTKKTCFIINFGVVFYDERIIIIDKDEVNQYDNVEKHWVKFRMWTYGEMLEWKNQCTEYDNNIKIHSLNSMKLEELKIRHLMKEWSFGENEIKLKLLHVNDYLSDESYQLLKNSLHHNIVKHIVDEMNKVLELNA